MEDPLARSAMGKPTSGFECNRIRGCVRPKQ